MLLTLLCILENCYRSIHSSQKLSVLISVSSPEFYERYRKRKERIWEKSNTINNSVITHYEILHVYFIYKSHKILFNVAVSFLSSSFQCGFIILFIFFSSIVLNFLGSCFFFSLSKVNEWWMCVEERMKKMNIIQNKAFKR